MSILTGAVPGINLAATSTSRSTRGAAPHSLVQSRGIGGRVSAPQIAEAVPEIGVEAKRSKVQIYRPGKAPKWADEPANDEPVDEPVLTSALARKRKLGTVMATREALAGDIQAKLLKVELDGKAREGAEPRRKRVAKVLEAEEPAKPEPAEPAAPTVPSIDTAGLEVPQAEEAVEDEDREARRRRVRERLRRKEQEEAEAAAAAALQAQAEQAAAAEGEAEAEEEEEEESEEEEEDLIPGRVLFKPLFVSKKDRATIAERDRNLADEEAAEAAGQARLEERRHESKQLVIQEIVREEQRIAAGVGEDGDSQPLPDDRDLEADAEAELEAWKLRELKRVLRDEQQRQEKEAEEAANKARKELSDEQIAALNRADPSKQKKAGNYKFLQKFYHKGSYYLDETEDVFKRDFTAATGVDAGIDKLALPKVMQVKKFGLKGRTKYTHLVDQDTSQKEANPWAEAEKMGQRSRLAGTGGFNKDRKDR